MVVKHWNRLPREVADAPSLETFKDTEHLNKNICSILSILEGKHEKQYVRAKQSQLPQPLLIRLVLQTLHQLHCPSLDTLQHLNVSLVVGGPKLNTGFEVRPHQCCPSPAGHAISDTSQDAIGFLGHLGTLLAHIQAVVNQHPQVLLCWAAFQPLFPKPVALHGVAVAQVQDLALGLVKPHTIDLGKRSFSRINLQPDPHEVTVGASLVPRASPPLINASITLHGETPPQKQREARQNGKNTDSCPKKDPSPRRRHFEGTPRNAQQLEFAAGLMLPPSGYRWERPPAAGGNAAPPSPAAQQITAAR
ncbi:hypothetical protein QYF61_002786 [Mycteria americana]|uniref:Uncharacterized protein n=1 Tax=Mycteria americana TaxID=33587 RepID=A0AAN7NKP2_MYCAM|nr:hypothetical protein QYF61_002786 [Mycteria americana]